MNYRIYKSLIFTLIELLVVIAIIAVLATMLLPVLQSAREKARSSFCINNLKTWGMAMIQYTETFGGYFPPNDSWNGGTNQKDRWYYVASIQGGFNTSTTKTRTASKLFCPSDPLPSQKGSINGSSFSSISYGYNSIYYGAFNKSSGTRGLGCRIEKVKFPTITLIVGERGSLDDTVLRSPATNIGYGSDDTKTSLPTNRHQGKATCTFPDGHAEQIKRSTLLYLRSETSKPINKYFGYSYQNGSFLTGE